MATSRTVALPPAARLSAPSPKSATIRLVNGSPEGQGFSPAVECGRKAGLKPLFLFMARQRLIGCVDFLAVAILPINGQPPRPSPLPQYLSRHTPPLTVENP